MNTAGADLAARSRRAQGLPPHVEDPGVMEAVAGLIRASGTHETPATRTGSPTLRFDLTDYATTVLYGARNGHREGP